ncbi:MAG: protoporphyrinogen oxidase [Acidobacteriota bacterium]
MNENGIPTIVVVGGGISGLAAAHRLVEESQRRQVPVDIKLLEASNRLGGWIHTSYRDDFVLEGGPDSFISDKPWGLALARRLGLDSQLIGTSESCRRSFIARGACLHSVPDGFYLLAPSRFWPFVTTPIFSWSGKFRMAADLVLPRRRGASAHHDETLANFVRRRLGREALERMAQPLVGGIYTSDPEKLSLRATMPRFLEMEQKHRSLILAMWRQRRGLRSQTPQGAGPRYGLFVSFDRGMQVFTDALVTRLPRRSVALNAPVVEVEHQAGTHRWRIRTEDGMFMESEALCLALPAYQSAKLLRGLDPLLANRLSRIEYASTATVNLAYRRQDIPHEMDGFGFVVPFVESRQLLACTFSHMKFAGRAPEGFALLRAFMGGAMQPQALELDDSEMVNVIRKNLQDLLGIKSEPLFTRVERHPDAMAQYGLGHLKLVEEIEGGVLRFRTLQLAGNGFGGVGIPDCIHRGEQAAERILASLYPGSTTLEQ